MAAWFILLAGTGIYSLMSAPYVLSALNPYYAAHFLLSEGLAGFFVLSQVVLCATGAEALYADMGQLGRDPIMRGWNFVFAALVLNYFGQGAYVLTHAGAVNVFFEMLSDQAGMLYVPFLLLTVAATVIASQALISGMFSIVYQGITTRILPMFRIDYTSTRQRSQIYIGSVNWFLMVFVIYVMLVFRQSHNLAAAYGLAVTGTMTITGVMMSWIFFLRKNRNRALLSVLTTFISFLFLVSCLDKIPYGGYWSLVIASIPFALILLYTEGQKRIYAALRPVEFHDFLKRYEQAYFAANRIKGTGVYFARDLKKIPSYIAGTMFSNGIIYEDNVIVSIATKDHSLGVRGFFRNDPAVGLHIYEISMGYLELIDVEKIMKGAGIDESTIFYGIEDIVTDNPIWRVFSVIKLLSPAFVQFYKLPPSKLHGVVVRVEI